MIPTIIGFTFRDIIKWIQVTLFINIINTYTIRKKSVIVAFEMSESENILWEYL